MVQRAAMALGLAGLLLWHVAIVLVGSTFAVWTTLCLSFAAFFAAALMDGAPEQSRTAMSALLAFGFLMTGVTAAVTGAPGWFAGWTLLLAATAAGVAATTAARRSHEEASPSEYRAPPERHAA